jgi:hypothetical protein
MSSLVQRARAIHERLRNPPNAVPDLGIDLKRVAITDHTPEPQPIPIKAVLVDCIPYSIGESVPKYRLRYQLQATPIRIEDIILAVCNRYKIRRVNLVSERRTADIVRPRHIGMYLAKRLTGRSYPFIAAKFGRHDHTTALHAVRKITAERLSDGALDAELTELESLFASPITSEDATCSSPQTPAQ